MHLKTLYGILTIMHLSYWKRWKSLESTLEANSPPSSLNPKSRRLPSTAHTSRISCVNQFEIRLFFAVSTSFPELLARLVTIRPVELLELLAGRRQKDRKRERERERVTRYFTSARSAGVRDANNGRNNGGSLVGWDTAGMRCNDVNLTVSTVRVKILDTGREALLLDGITCNS